MADSEFDAENFPEQLYLMAFGDVRAAVRNGAFKSGYEHYTTFGKTEIAAGRRTSPFEPGPPGLARHILPPSNPRDPVPPAPAPMQQPASGAAIAYTPPPPLDLAFPTEADLFSEKLYVAQNPDIAPLIASGTYKDGYAHWQKIGRAEEQAGLRPSITADALYTACVPPGTDCPVDMRGFDHESYFALYPDVLEALGNDPQAARHHWTHHGRFEGRIGTGIAPYKHWRARPEAVCAKPFGIDIYAPFAATSGLGTAARRILRAVESVGIPIELHIFDVSKGIARITPAERAHRPMHRINLLMANADQIANLTSLYPAGHFDDAYNIAMWAWELPAFRPDWQPSFAPIDEVWTNSDFELESIGAVAPVPVHKIPLPVEVVPASPEHGRAMFGIPPDRIVFMLAFDVGSTSARKNPMLAVEAFREAFAPEDRVFLVLKFHSAAAEPAIARALMRALRGMDNVLVISDRLAERDMDFLRAACDCLVSPHRSEGFGLNIAEFMALGKPAIATGYSGNLEFFDATVGYPIEYRLIELDQATGPYMPHYVWADPRKDSLIAQLRAVYQNQAEAWSRGQRGARRIRENFSAHRIGHEIRLRLHRIGATQTKPDFLAWLGRTRAMVGAAPLSTLTQAQKQAVRALGPKPPVISLIVPVYNISARLLQECVLSVFAQTYPFWELCLCDDASTDPGTLAVLARLQGADPRVRIRRLPQNLGIAGASNKAAEMATGAFIAMLDNDDTIEPDATLAIAQAVVADPSIDVIYTDEDKIDENGNRIDTYYKPDWSPEHLESVMYVLHMLTVRKSLFLNLGGFRELYPGAQDYDLMLRLSRQTAKIHHIARALYHWRAVQGSAASVVDAKPEALRAGLRALQDHAAELHGEAAWVEDGLLPGLFRMRRKIVGTPRVSLLILTNNGMLDLPGRGKFHMVDNFVDSILRRTAYRNYEIVVVDNSKLKKKQLARFEALGVRVENFPGKVVPFNYAAKANFALRACRTEHLVMLNDDMEIADGDWLANLLELSQNPDIGAVGARLLHADGTVQHVGCVIGVNGGSAHVYHSYPGDFVGYNAFTHVVRNYSAVTGACLATRKSVLNQVGGFDENFAIDFNDTDLCLRMVEGGYRVVYTPYCTLFHFEGASARRATQSVEERRRFVARWGRYMENDPYFNPNFSREHFDFTLR